MGAYLLRRTVSALLLLLLVLTATFFLLHLAPGDPASLLADPRVSDSAREQLRRLWGIDRPLAVQYAGWLGHALVGDWGTSFTYGRPAGRVLLGALPATLLLGAAALLLQVAIAVPLGVRAARRPGGRVDRTLGLASLVLYSTPTFWLALMALLLLSYRFPLFPPSHMTPPGGGASGLAGGIELLRHLALPALVLGLSAAGGWLRYVRSGMVGALAQPHLLALAARGLGTRRLVWRHALRTAAAPLLQLLALSLPALLGGALVTEVVFAWPGLGRLTYGALLARDYPLILACTAWSGLLVVVGSLLADLLLALVDPRVRDGG